MNWSFHGMKGPFTPAQWTELENQAFIYKCLVANVPVPTNLLIPLQKALASSAFCRFPGSSLPSRPHSLELTLVPTTATPHPPPAANVCLDVQPFSTDAASRQQPKTKSERSFEDEFIVNSQSFYTDSLELTLVPTTATPHPPPAANVGLDVQPFSTDSASRQQQKTQSERSFEDEFIVNSQSFYTSHELNVSFTDSLELTLVPTTATPHTPPAANVDLDVQPLTTDSASRQQPKTQSKRSFEDESIVNSLSFYTAVSSHHSDLEYSFKTAASSWHSTGSFFTDSDLEYSFKTAASSCHSTGSFFTDSIPEIEMGTESQAETETRDLRMRFASRFWGVGASSNGSFSVLKEQILDTIVESVVSGIVQECMRRFFDCL